MRERMEAGLRERLPRLDSADGNAAELKRRLYRAKGEIVVRNLQRNGFEACYAETREEAAQLLLARIPEGSTVGCGDSHTVFALDVEDRLREKDCDLISHRCAMNRDALEHPDASDLMIGSREEQPGGGRDLRPGPDHCDRRNEQGRAGSQRRLCAGGFSGRTHQQPEV